MGFLIASNLLLWVAVIALGIGYFTLVSQRGHQPHVGKEPASLVGNTLPDRVAEVLPGAVRSDKFTLLFLSGDCEPCRNLAEHLRQPSARTGIPVFVVGEDPVDGPDVAGQAATSAAVKSLQRELQVHQFPFLWTVDQGTLVAGGIVNSIADIRRLAMLSSE